MYSSSAPALTIQTFEYWPLAPQIAHEKLGKPALLALDPLACTQPVHGPLKTAKTQASSAMLRRLLAGFHAPALYNPAQNKRQEHALTQPA